MNAPMTDPLYVATKTMPSARAELGGKSGAAFDVAYLAGQPADHLLVLKMIEEGQKVANGDNKKALDEAHTMVMQHKEHAEKAVESPRRRLAAARRNDEPVNERGPKNSRAASTQPAVPCVARCAG